MKKPSRFLAGVILNALAVAAVHAREPARWENQQVGFSFDAGKGTFSITDQRDQEFRVGNAVLDQENSIDELSITGSSSGDVAWKIGFKP